jgi:hypothetical protein
LRDRFGIKESSLNDLLNKSKMGFDAHTNIHQAWITYADARKAILTKFAAFSSEPSLPQRVVYTVFKMIEYSGMQSAYFISHFLQAMPLCATYSCVRPALQAYISSVREVAAAPAHLQPYYKVIHGDSTRAFHRNTIFVLAACAIAYEKYTSSSMANFSLGEETTAAVNLFDAEAVRHGHHTIQKASQSNEIRR